MDERERDLAHRSEWWTGWVDGLSRDPARTPAVLAAVEAA